MINIMLMDILNGKVVINAMKYKLYSEVYSPHKLYIIILSSERSEESQVMC
jgi:hypothetical protein